MVPKTERFEMRVDEDIIARVDTWRAEQPDSLSRAEAIRRLVEAGLAHSSGETVHFSDGEKLIVLMLVDLYKHLKVKAPEVDPLFVSETIWGGHYWAAKWELPGIFHGHEDDPRDLREVVDVLDMWDFIEGACDGLGKKDREKLEKDAIPFGKLVRFPGFDGNNESSHLAIAGFLVNKMGRFSRFAGRDLNSHAPLLGAYRRMLRVFDPMRANLAGGGLSAAQLGSVVRAQAYPK
jgi:uncharacterized protein YfbU (UPF0304 family)